MKPSSMSMFGRAVLTHGAELHQVRIGRECLDREQHVERVHDVVRLREDRVLAVLHRVRRRRHLAVVHDRLRSELAEHALGDRPVARGRPPCTPIVLAGHVLPGGDALRAGRPGSASANRCRPRRVRGDAGSRRRRGPRGRGSRTASRSATRGSRRRRGSGCASQGPFRPWGSPRDCTGGEASAVPGAAGLRPGRPARRGPGRRRRPSGSGRSRSARRRRMRAGPSRSITVIA